MERGRRLIPGGAIYALAFVSITGCTAAAPHCAAHHNGQGHSKGHGFGDADPRHWLVDDIMMRIHALQSWPSMADDAVYDAAAWQRVIDLAAMLQKADPLRLQYALRDYVLHYATAFEPGVDAEAEWSKPLLLLRVMFQVPEDTDLERFHPVGCMGFGGFGFAPDQHYEETPLTLATPLAWTDRGPVLTASRAGYNGAPYAAEEEYIFLRRHFGFRDLSKWTTEKDR